MTTSCRATMVAIVLALAGCAPAAPDAPAGTGGAGPNGGTGGMGVTAGTGGTGTGGVDETSGTGGDSATGGGSSGGTGETGGVVGTGGGASGQSGGAGGGSAGRGPSSGGMGGSVPAPTAGPGCPAGAFLCEGFETQMAGAAPGSPWTPDLRGAGKILVDTSKSFSGQNAVHVTGMTNKDRANVQIPMVIAAKTVWVRFMMYTASYPSSSGVHTRLMRLGTAAAAAKGDPESSYSLANYNGTAIEKVNSVYLRSTGTHLNDSAVKNRWVCWEWEIDKTGGAGKVAPHIWVD
ncbi:MAG: hypothetical protein ABIS92_15750, partial [Polyangia bacterium]